VPIDILKTGAEDGGGGVWIRVPAGDLRKVLGAVGGFGGWRVVRAGRWLAGLVGEAEEEGEEGGGGVWGD
jgi:hypothetical protein